MGLIIVDEYKNGFNFAIEQCIDIIHKVMVERYGTHISHYDLLLTVKNRLIELSFTEHGEK